MSKEKRNLNESSVAVVGGGPAGMTIALLLAKYGHKVRLYESGSEIGGLWSAKHSRGGAYLGENSCKVYQGSYNTAPALFNMIGTRWENHFVPRHDLKTNWLKPFLKDCTKSDLLRLSFAFLLDSLHLKSYKKISVEEFLLTHKISEACRSWLRATALGGVTGTLRMSMWELGHRLRSNVSSIFQKKADELYWNKQPPNSPAGFIPIWKEALRQAGVEIFKNASVAGLVSSDSSRDIELKIANAAGHRVKAVFLAVPPPALSKILERSSSGIVAGFGHSSRGLKTILNDSIYQHLGLVWFFDRPIPENYPLAGYNVRKGWHPILVQYPQYSPYLNSKHVTAVVGSVSLAIDFLHHRLGTRISRHSHREIAKIIWEDERLANPNLPEPVDMQTLGISSATQIVHHGVLPVKSAGHQVYIGTNLNGQSPYFTSSLEAAIQAGAATAREYEPGVQKLPMGP